MELLNSSEAAELLGVTPQWISVLARRKELRPVKESPGGRGNTRVFRRVDVEELRDRRAAAAIGRPRRGRPRKVDLARQLRLGVAESIEQAS